MVGPNESDTITAINEAPGDPDLDVLADATTEDASILSFTFVPADPTVTFRYVFASDEYNEFVHRGFNDVFGFFVNGTNCAKVPDTDIPVSIDTINGGNPFGSENASHPDLYRNNEIADGSAPIDTEMDGLTVVLTCTATVTPGEPNTAKLAIADAGDAQLDSAVFLEAGSFSSGPTTHTLSVTTSGDGDGVVISSDDGISCDSTVPRAQRLQRGVRGGNGGLAHRLAERGFGLRRVDGLRQRGGIHLFRHDERRAYRGREVRPAVGGSRGGSGRRQVGYRDGVRARSRVERWRGRVSGVGRQRRTRRRDRGHRDGHRDERHRAVGLGHQLDVRGSGRGRRHLHVRPRPRRRDQPRRTLRSW